jgi:hypothetical protein
MTTFPSPTRDSELRWYWTVLFVFASLRRSKDDARDYYGELVQATISNESESMNVLANFDSELERLGSSRTIHTIYTIYLACDHFRESGDTTRTEAASSFSWNTFWWRRCCTSLSVTLIIPLFRLLWFRPIGHIIKYRVVHNTHDPRVRKAGYRVSSRYFAAVVFVSLHSVYIRPRPFRDHDVAWSKRDGVNTSKFCTHR